MQRLLNLPILSVLLLFAIYTSLDSVFLFGISRDACTSLQCIEVEKNRCAAGDAPGAGIRRRPVAQIAATCNATPLTAFTTIAAAPILLQLLQTPQMLFRPYCSLFCVSACPSVSERDARRACS